MEEYLNGLIQRVHDVFPLEAHRTCCSTATTSLQMCHVAANEVKDDLLVYIEEKREEDTNIANSLWEKTISNQQSCNYICNRERVLLSAELRVMVCKVTKVASSQTYRDLFILLIFSDNNSILANYQMFFAYALKKKNHEHAFIELRENNERWLIDPMFKHIIKYKFDTSLSWANSISMFSLIFANNFESYFFTYFPVPNFRQTNSYFTVLYDKILHYLVYIVLSSKELSNPFKESFIKMQPIIFRKLFFNTN